MARRIFIRLQLRKSLCVRVQSVLVLFSGPYLSNKKKTGSISSDPEMKSLSPSCVRVENFGTSISGMCVSNKKTAFNYLYPFSSFSVHKFCGRTDGRTFFEKVSLFLPDQEYIYMSIPIFIISPISAPMTYFWPTLVYLFSILEIGLNPQHLGQEN